MEDDWKGEEEEIRRFMRGDAVDSDEVRSLIRRAQRHARAEALTQAEDLCRRREYAIDEHMKTLRYKGVDWRLHSHLSGEVMELADAIRDMKNAEPDT